MLESAPAIDVVVPLYNERESLAELHAGLLEALTPLTPDFRIFFVNDGSTDGSDRELNRLAGIDKRVQPIHLLRNFGKSAALDVGFRRSTADRVVTLDADLQDDPSQIPKLLQALDDGCDVVTGRRKKRRDRPSKVLASWIFNRTVSGAFGLRLRDLNCGFKAFRGKALQGFFLYGELHRYIPILMYSRGFRVTEVEIEHQPRKYGASKYGWARIVRGGFDLLTVMMITRVRSKPLHFFGSLGLILSGLGVSVLAVLAGLGLKGHPISGSPLLFLGTLLLIVGAQLVTTGLLGELLAYDRYKRDRLEINLGEPT